MDGEEHRLKGCRSAFLAVLLLSLAAPAQTQIACAGRTAACEALAGLRLPDVTIVNADAIGRGKFTSPDGETHAVPAFCRIHGAARPTSDSLIHFELWLPAARWNGRYYQLGNGGFAGAIHYPSLAAEIRALNAVAATDTGHRASPFDAAWAQGHPEKIVDYGYRSLKSTSDAAQTLIRAYYSTPAKRSYFIGCSNGGRQALMVAQRFPEDWDGVLAGAPAHDWTGQLTSFAAIQQALRNDSESWIPPRKLPAIQRAALESCTPAARVANGVPTDPRFCALDPAALACRGEVTDECLTASQAAVLGRIQNVFEPTAALAAGHWANWMLNVEPRAESHLTFAEQFFRHMVFEDSGWSIEALDAKRDLAFAQKKLGHVLDATQTDLTRFERHGAKLLMYFGWADALISPRAGVDYYERVSERMGGAERTQSFFRLFMVPGMTHCQGGPGPHAFGQAQIAPALHDDALHDIRRALETWVERGIAPDRLIATKYVNDDPSQGVAMTATLYPLRGTHGRF